MKDSVLVKCGRCDGKGTIRWPNPERLRAQRLAAEISLRQLAKKYGVTAPYLHDIETGRRRCTPHLEALYQKLESK